MIEPNWKERYMAMYHAFVSYLIATTKCSEAEAIKKAATMAAMLIVVREELRTGKPKLEVVN